MRVLSFSETRARLKEVMDSVVDDHAPVVVIRKRGEAVVMVSLADWRAMEETLHLFVEPSEHRASARRDQRARGLRR